MSVRKPSRGRRHPASTATITTIAALAFAGTGAVTAAGSATAAPGSVPTVTTSDASWVTQAYECFEGGADLSPQQQSADGPVRTPFGSTSHQITINESTAQTELYRTPAYDNLKLADLTRLEYSTFAKSNKTGTNERQPTYLRLSVDSDGSTGENDPLVRDTSLYFIPANNGTVTQGTWQTWDVAHGKLSVNGDDGAQAAVSLSAFLADHPQATLVNNDEGKPTGGALALLTGCGLGGNTDTQRNGVYYVDRVIVGASGKDTLYDLGSGNESKGETSTEVVDPSNGQGWVGQAWDAATNRSLAPTRTFVPGPASASAGVGSARFVISDDTNPNRVEQLRTPSYDNRLLRDVRTLGYSTFQRPLAGTTAPQQPVVLRLTVKPDAESGAESLYFYPANNGDVRQGAWQKWNAAEGKWNVGGDSGNGELTLADYVVQHPDAKIVNNADGSPLGGGVTLQVGAGGDNQLNGEFFVDDVTLGAVDEQTAHVVGGTQYDFEPTIPVPSVRIADASVTEGNSGVKTMSFRVTLDKSTFKPVTVKYSTQDSTAVSTSDYVATSGELTFAPGQTTKTVSVSVRGGMGYEANERFLVKLATPSFGTVADGSAYGTIVNDDTSVGLTGYSTNGQVRVKVSTTAAAPKAALAVYQSVAGTDPKLASSTLDSSGRADILLSKKFKKGTKVALYTKVTTASGTYTSPAITVTVS